MKARQSRIFPAPITKDQAKDSGMAFVLILLLIGLFAKGGIYFKIAAGALLIDMIFPMFYYPFAIFWFGISGILGAVFSKVLLVLVYLIIVVPVALWRRLLGKDNLSLKGFKKSAGTVMRSRNHVYQPADLEKPF